MLDDIMFVCFVMKITVHWNKFPDLPKIQYSMCEAKEKVFWPELSLNSSGFSILTTPLPSFVELSFKYKRPSVSHGHSLLLHLKTHVIPGLK